MNKALARAGMIDRYTYRNASWHMIIGQNRVADVKFAAPYARVVVELWGTVEVLYLILLCYLQLWRQQLDLL